GGEDIELVLAAGLKYPTGLAYYEDVGNDWLFVAETLNNKIIKINLSNYQISTVIGDGSDTDCGSVGATRIHTAKFCELNMPTALYSNYTDPNNQELYIADSGNNRILKVTDSANDLANTEIKFITTIEAKISKVEFVFPNGTTNLANISDDDGNDLLAELQNKYETDDGNRTIAYNFNAEMTGSTAGRTGTCTGDGCTPPQYFDMFSVNADDNIFTDGDDILINGENYTINSVYPNNIDITVEANTHEGSFPASTVVKINNVFPAQEYTFGFDLSGINISSGFQNIEIKIYDINETLIETHNHVLRISDEILGTEEDAIEEVASGGSIVFPTGVSKDFYANSETNEIVDFSGTLLGPYALNPIDINNFTTFDYVSDFPINSLTFYKYNGGKILELVVETDNQTYKLNAKIP
ncbi:MAG: hypothetical protein V3W20_04035, partial [Candidatus Neomarinimicrobiota bacterium]